MAPSKPTLTEKNLPDQTGKVFIVTGATSGIGKELTKILYQHNAKVYLAVRSPEKASEVITDLKNMYPSAKGDLHFLNLDLNDLGTIKSSAEEFLRKETKLDVLWNNAGVMIPPQGSKTKQGYELQLGTNALAPFLFTKLLTPILSKTAQLAPPGRVRVVWVSSSASANFAPQGGVDMSNLDYHVDKGTWAKYGASKAANILHARTFAEIHKQSGIVSVSLDPGNLKTDLYRHTPWWQKPIINLVLKQPIYGAYTELFAGLSEVVTPENNGAWIEPWGQIKTHSRKDIENACKPKVDGGSGIAEEFWQWSEQQVSQYA